jgi:hypothetical protein
MKTIKKYSRFTVLMLTCLVTILLSQSLEANNLIGTWTGIINGRQVDMDFRTDGTLVFAGQTLQYTTKPGQLIVSIGGQQSFYGLQFSGNQLQLTGADIGGTVTFTRKNSAQGPNLLQPKPAPNTNANGLIGVWAGIVNGRQVDLVFRSDGSLSFVGQTMQYSTKPGQLIVSMGGQQSIYGLQLSGNQLMLTGADIGGTVTFTRKSSTPGSQAGNNFPKAQPGQRDPALIGTWYRNESSYSGSYGGGPSVSSDTRIKVAFDPNGQVAYGSGTVVFGGGDGVSIHSGARNTNMSYGTWTTTNGMIHVTWQDGSRENFQYGVFPHQGTTALWIMIGGKKKYFER